MKKVLIIANQYPPMGGSGVQRSAKFVKYLPDFDFQPVVLTREMSKGLLDQSLFDDLPDHKIYRTKAYDFTQWPGFLSLAGKVIARKIMIPDGDYFWNVFSFDKAVKIIEEEKIDIIYSTSYPYSGHLLGMKLKKRFPHLPWVVDFRDEWTKNPYIIDMNLPKFRMKKEKAMEEKVVSLCDAFITNTRYMLDNFLEDYPDLDKKSYVIPNGFDDSDFSAFDTTYFYKDTFRLTYAGAMYGRRKPTKLFEAVRRLTDAGKVDLKDLHIRLIGAMDVPRIKGYIEDSGLDQVVTMEDYLPHKEAIEALTESDALLLIIGEGKGAKNFASGKIFEYINCHRPILGIVPEEGAAADIIRETQAGIVCETSSVEAIEAGFLALYEDWKHKTLIREVNTKEVNAYHRKNLTSQLVNIFESKSL